MWSSRPWLHNDGQVAIMRRNAGRNGPVPHPARSRSHGIARPAMPHSGGIGWTVREMGTQGSSHVTVRRIMARVAALAGAWQAAPAMAALNIDPEGSGVLVGAVRWLEGTLLGPVATVVEVSAVASVGFMADELALWGDRDPGLLHPVRRGQHRRRHSFDRAGRLSRWPIPCGARSSSGH